MTFRLVDGALSPEKWDRFVESDPQSTFCHQYRWKEIMRDVLGHESVYVAATDDDGTWRGVLPLVRVRNILGHYLISLPFLNDGGPLGDPDAQRALVEYAVTEAEQSGAGLLELRSRSELRGPVTPVHRKISVQLRLPSSAEEFWNTTLRAKLRAQIRRPMKEGMVFRCGVEEMHNFYQVFARNMRDLGTPVLPMTFFEKVADTFGSRVVFAAVYTNAGVPVAGACCFVWRKELEAMWASSLREFNHLSPNMLLYCRLMEYAIGHGIEIFNFGRSSPDGGTHKFKKQWGGHDIPLPWASWSREQGIGVPSADRPLYRLAVTAWRHLPTGVANRLGPVFARMLP
ncbi:MAG TPA: FemAB family XrtA/PEP-CTERM system-associated protein [Gemmatimonadaceae bacterium]